jgi:hypothetical protein
VLVTQFIPRQAEQLRGWSEEDTGTITLAERQPYCDHNIYYEEISGLDQSRRFFALAVI